MSRASHGQRGLTLVELLVAVTVLAVATVMALTLYDAARASYKIGQNVTEQQQTVRIAFDLMTQDLRMAGFNTNPDGNRSRPDEQIEGAFATALVIRADFDAADPVAAADPETTLSTGAFPAVSTGNDEIRTFVLERPDGTASETLSLEADVVPLARDGAVETIVVGGLALTHDAPPYTLYRYSFNNDPTTFGSAAFVNKTVMAENVRALRFRYFDQAGNEIAPPGGADTTAAIASRRTIHSIRVELEVLTRDPDPDWQDLDDPDPSTRRFRKFSLASQITPRNLRRRGVRDLVADNTPPGAPASPQLYPGHCGGLYVGWDPCSEPDVAYYRILLGTDPFALGEVRFAEVPGYYFGDLSDATPYHVAIQAVDDSGNPGPLSPTSLTSTSDTTVPRTPSGMSASDSEPGRIRLQWSPTTENEGSTVGDPDSPMVRDLAGYRVYRATSSGFTPAPANLHADETSLWAVAAPEFTDTEVANCRRYYYRVRAVDRCGVESASTAEVTGQSYTNVRPLAPTSLVAHFGGTDRVRLYWKRVDEDEAGNPTFIENYNIYRTPLIPEGTTPVVPDDFVFRAGHSVIGPGTAFNDLITVPPGQTVWYMIRARDECSPANESVPSEIVRPLCEFSGETVFWAPGYGSAVQGDTLVRVHVSAGTGTYETVRLKFTSLVDGSEYDVTINETASTWDYIWQTSNQPPFVPGPYDVRAEVDQRIDATTICTDVRTTRVVVEE